MLARAVALPAVTSPGSAISSPVLGISLALLAFGLFTVMDTVVKVLGSSHHLAQVMFFNCLFGFIVNLVIVSCQGQWRNLRTRRLKLHVLRWAISFGGSFCSFYAYTQLPLADVYAILFTAPLLITALSVPLLGERVGWRRWTAISVGFFGVLVMLRPGSSSFDLLALLAMVGALAHALNMIIVRKLGQTDPAVSFGFFGNLLGMATLSFVLPFVWMTPTPGELALNMVAGAIAGGGFWLLASAFRQAPAAVVAPFQYSQMPFGVLSGWLLYATVPDQWILLGATIVIGSGFYVLQREAHLLRAARSLRPRVEASVRAA